SLPKFGQRYGYADINNFDVLILPGGNRLDQLFRSDQRYELKRWVEQGGTIIALENAASFFSEKYKFGSINVLKAAPDTSEAAKYLAFGERESYRGLRRIPGSALRTEIDTTHPLAFGVKPETFGLKLNTNALLPDAGLESVGIYHRDPTQLLTAGYANQANLERLSGKTFAGVQRIGNGSIVHLVDNPHYRMFWRGNSRMMQNAAFMLPAF
ncbi:MAG: peptidase M14, partial [Bacteroidota bacterium]